MDQEQNTSLFGFGIDDISRTHLAEAAKWAKFLAIVGFIVCGLIVLLAFFAGSILAIFSNSNDAYRGSTAFAGGAAVFVTVFYIGIAILFFLPYLFLFRFAARMKTALNTNDQLTLNSSFQNLKVMFRYVGILTIILLCFYGLGFLILIVTAITANA